MVSQLVAGAGPTATIHHEASNAVDRGMRAGAPVAMTTTPSARPSLNLQPSLFSSGLRLRSSFSTSTKIGQLAELRPTADELLPPAISYPNLPFNDDALPTISPISIPRECENESEVVPPLPTRPRIPSHTPLTFRFTNDARCKGPSGGPTYWTHKMYQGPNGELVTLHYCPSTEITERVARLFHEDRVLGFDMEWKAQAHSREGIKKNVALIQLANESRVGLFHVAVFQEPEQAQLLMPPTLKKIIESPEITKVGVSIKADCTRLRNFLGLDPQGLFELSHLHRLVKYSVDEPAKVNRKLVSLSEQAEEHLGMPIWKGDDVRSGDWTRALDRRQMDYAATDAYAVLHLYDVLETKRRQMDPTPPHPTHAELDLPVRLAEEQITQSTAGATGVGRKRIVSSTRANMADDEEAETSIPNAEYPPRSEDVKSSRRKITEKGYISKHPHFDLADTWALGYYQSTPDGSNSTRSLASPEHARRAQLRAYALWHSHGHEVDDIARVLRDPPLQRSTVAMYIVEALRKEKLENDVARLRAVLDHLPAARKRRYQYLLYNARGTPA